MTTIVSNGYFLIADRRSTIRVETNYLTGGEIKRGDTRFYKDQTNKIITPQNIYIGDKLVRAIACSGNIDFIFYTLSLSKLGFDINLPSIFACVAGIPAPSKVSCTLLAVTEDNVTHKFRFVSTVTSGENLWRVDSERFAPGTIVVAGSGGDVWDETVPLLTDGRDMDVLDVFTFCAHRDSWSSDHYSVYGVTAHELFEDVRPREEEIFESMRRISDKIRHFRPENKPKAIK